MCAIAGVFSVRNGFRPEAVEMVEAMCETQRHRGPDGGGVFTDHEITLGHRRLSIVDLSDAGSQPMTSRDGRWTVVFNGEIFNFVELRSQLNAQMRFPFRGTSDTEVLLEGCSAWGIKKTVEQAAGMFGFALWDAQERVLTLARDRLGEKPVVYCWDGRTLGFASELKALAPLHQRRLDPWALDTYLALGYVPAPLAIFRNCRKLAAGHLLHCPLGGEPRIERWWFPENKKHAPSAVQSSRHARIATLRGLLGQAVRQRLRADVPVALSLSGGIDSSVIAAECAAQAHQPVAFTVSFTGGKDHGLGDAADDLVCARTVARHLGLQHEVLAADPAQMALDWERIVEHFDEPFADSSTFGCRALGQALAGQYKVILNGDGGDESFGGYRHYERIGLKQWIKRAAAGVGLLDGTGATQVYVQSKALFRAAGRKRLMGEHARGNGLNPILAVPPHNLPQGSALWCAVWSDRHLPLANGLTYKMDLALSWFGIEGRAPLLDHRLVEWTHSLPENDMVSGHEKKILLRAAYADRLPVSILNRPKQGFGAPIGEWMAGPLRDLMYDLLPCPLLDLKEQRGHRGQRLWALLALAGWARQWKVVW